METLKTSLDSDHSDNLSMFVLASPQFSTSVFLIRRWASFLGNDWCRKRVGVQVNVKILKTKQTHTNSLCGSLDLFAMVFVVQHCFFARPRLQFFQSEASCCDSDDVSGNFFWHSPMVVASLPRFPGLVQKYQRTRCQHSWCLMFVEMWCLCRIFHCNGFVRNGVKCINKKQWLCKHSIDNPASKVTRRKYQLQAFLYIYIYK